jgi:hypothetical protein
VAPGSAIRLGEIDIGSVRLTQGSHASPREGLCAAELASIMGGEPFSDRPRCVCRVIAAFLRCLNDRVAHAERQLLVPYAARSVGTRSGRRVTRMRRDVCLLWAGAQLRGGPARRTLGRLAMRLRILVVVGLRAAVRLDEGAGEYAARVVFARHGSGEAFALLDRLLELEAAPLAHPVQGPAQARVAAAIRELGRETQVAEQENGRKRADHNGHARHLGGRDPGQGDEEDVERDRARNGNPERETDAAEDLHRLARVP